MRKLVILVILVLISAGVMFLHRPKEDKVKFLSTSIYPTETYPTLLQWLGNNELIVYSEGQILKLDTTSREQDVLLDSDNVLDMKAEINRVLVVMKRNEKIYLQTLSLSGTLKAITSLPSAEFALFGQDHLCLTTINTISKPTDVATEITLVEINDNKNPKQLTSSLTLVPITCSEDLWLVPPAPLLQDYIYLWERNRKHPTAYQKLTTPDIRARRNCIAIRTNDCIRTMQNSDIKDFPIPDDIEAWGLNKDCATSFISKNELHIMSKNTEHVHKIPDLNESFTDIVPSPSANQFALISETGELWILKTVKE